MAGIGNCTSNCAYGVMEVGYDLPIEMAVKRMATNIEEINAVPIYPGIAPTNLDIAKGINFVFEEIALVHIQLLKRMGKMAEQIDRLNAAVEQELADDSAQNQLIADLKAQLETAKAAVDGAVAGEEAAKADLQAALDAATDAAVKLEGNDAPSEETPQQ